MTQELFDIVCERMSAGESLTQVCSDKNIPRIPGVMRFIDADASGDRRARYVRARELMQEYWAGEIKQISDTPVEGEKTEISAQFGKKVTRGDMIDHRRLQIDARKWLLSKLAPHKYGDKVDLNVGGQPAGAPLNSLSILAVTNDPIEAAKVYQAVMRGDVVPALPTPVPTDE